MEDLNPEKVWKKCSSCKKPIQLGQRYYLCSVSTCNGQRTGYVFCSVSCFETHLPGARHKSAGAVEQFAPKTKENETSLASMPSNSAHSTNTAETFNRTPQKIIVKSATSAPTTSTSAQLATTKEVLVIASRLKDYIQAKADMNTSASVMDVLSDHLRIITERAIENARAEGRKTVLDRDYSFLKK